MISTILLAATVALGPWDIGTTPPQRCEVLADAGVVVTPEPESLPMLDVLRGVGARLGAKDVTALRTTGSPGRCRVEDLPADWRAWRTLRLHAGNQDRDVVLGRDGSGRLVLRMATGHGDKGVLLWQERAGPMAWSWAPTLPGDAVPRPGVTLDRTIGNDASVIVLDAETFDARFWAGKGTGIGGSTRDAAKEHVLVRLPKGHEARRAEGVLVWVDAADHAPLHEELIPACDELGLVLVSPSEAGNDRPTPDRYQLALDGVSVAESVSIIDRRRIYVSGVSGGGKIATHLCVCWPEVFRGAVPVVGVGLYREVRGDDGTRWRADFQAPRNTPLARSLAGHRFGAITGSQDFNHGAISATMRMMSDDGLEVRVFDVDGMGHQVAPAGRFGEAIRWVDEKAFEARANEQEAAARAMRAAEAVGGPTPQSDAWKAALVNVTRVGPWTPEAWRAAELLGVVRAREGSN